MEKEPVMCL